MASGPPFGGNGDQSREKHRWTESKVYTRKTPNKSSSNNKILQSQLTESDVPVLTRSAAASDDSSSRRMEGKNGRVKINLACKSKQEVRELRRKLTNELAQVRVLVKKLEAKELHMSGNDRVENSGNGNSLKRMHSDVGSMVGRHHTHHNQLSVSVSENVIVGEKEKRTPKANQFYRNSEFVLAKDKFPPTESNKKSKSKHSEGSYGIDKQQSTQVFKSCNALLGKIMKHKHGWVFNTPVDVKKLGLHDYHLIIKQPMDLGTVKSRLNKNWYKSPREFAEDVRLTFHNAMTYNPKGQDVHIMAELLLNLFEERWVVMQSEYNLNSWFEGGDHEYGAPTPTSKKTPVPPPFQEMRRTIDRSESTTAISDAPKTKHSHSTHSGRIPVPKKPKAKEPNKRDMTYEEKQRLSMNLQSLPPEKLDNIVQIIKKRNSSLCQRDDEIEVDIDVVDTETLWELDRFVTNYKKSLSKTKKKVDVPVQPRAESENYVQEMVSFRVTYIRLFSYFLPFFMVAVFSLVPPDCLSSLQDMAPVAREVVETKTEAKIDDRNVSSSSPVQQGEKQGGSASKSSSSSSSSSDSGSSSSDSDSDSSSASDGGH
ncbi:hypothetical protein ACHQM5_002836 [Ranunculus cassubicifolius]